MCVCVIVNVVRVECACIIRCKFGCVPQTMCVSAFECGVYVCRSVCLSGRGSTKEEYYSILYRVCMFWSV